MEIHDGKYCVYCHTNKYNGKKYIGLSSNIKKRWKGHGRYYIGTKYFWNALCKYGWDNFEHEIIASNLTENEASNFERLLISKLNTANINFGYNLQAGGLSGNPIRQLIPVKQYDLHGNYIKTYPSVSKAAEDMGDITNTTRISSCCKHKEKRQYNGYMWSYGDYTISEPYSGKNKKVNMYTLEGEFVKCFSSAKDAAKEMYNNKTVKSERIIYLAICDCCRGRISSTHGFRWGYEINGLKPIRNKRKVLIHKYDLTKKLICTYSSLSELEKKENIDRHNFTLNSLNKNHIINGFYWDRESKMA